MSYLALAIKAEKKLRHNIDTEKTPHSKGPFPFKDIFQERAAIREYDGTQPRVEAELGAIEEVLPQLTRGELIIPLNTPARYRWWAGGQSIEEILRELGASEETIKRYVANKTGGVPKPKERRQ